MLFRYQFLIIKIDKRINFSNLQKSDYCPFLGSEISNFLVCDFFKQVFANPNLIFSFGNVLDFRHLLLFYLLSFDFLKKKVLKQFVQY